MKTLILLLTLIVQFNVKSQCPDIEDMRLLEVVNKLKKSVVSAYWSDWNHVPMTLLFVTQDDEYLYNYRPLDDSFELVCDSIYSRKRTQPLNLLAAFPLVDWKPTIVVGQQKNTNTKSSGHWVMTLMHEHLHQFQYSHPNYFVLSNGLSLAKDDNDFMWQLNYPFPYKKTEVENALHKMQGILLNFLESGKPNPQKYLKAKNDLKSIISEKDYSYLNLQLWQEGFARFVEIKLLETWISRYDTIGISEFSKEELNILDSEYYYQIKKDLANGKSGEMGRIIFYSIGAVEAMLIENINPEWKQNYFSKLFDTDALFYR